MKNKDAFIADLLGITPENDKPYAELWMGTHPSAPSTIIDFAHGELSLSDWLAADPVNHLSRYRSAAFSTGLPYLFKVLSANEALSIQAHPDKSQAEQLHQQDPEHYPDSNHKPEIAIAIDSLDALIGLLSDQDYEQVLGDIPELRALLYSDNASTTGIHDDVLKILRLWENQPDAIETCIGYLHNRLAKKSTLTESESLFLNQTEIHGQRDVGLLFLFLLNRVHLGPGEAVYLPPGVPHAYLRGNIIECMANSDNVVRLGLTKKFCDSKALSRILTKERNTDFRVATSTSGPMTVYQTSVNEFQVSVLKINAKKSHDFTGQTELTLFLILDGLINFHWCSDEADCMSIFRRGDAFISPANLSNYSLRAKQNSSIYVVKLP
ncbi:MAG: mannose-6-phosphate isomerase, class I [Candidatus Marinimicrobia bacterium]|nr:mannose-6-phosphate isomerase, class I [Candidatus Neomarinimicrobiota bacterium]